jgi:DNA-directed RNA polymerase subunit RPC12/RpoP
MPYDKCAACGRTAKVNSSVDEPDKLVCLACYKPVFFKEKEEEMPFEKGNQDWLKLPKVGESYDFSVHGAITEIKKVEGGKGFNFTQKKTEKLFDANGNEKEVTTEVDLGYRYEISFTDGKKMSVSDWKSYYAFIEADVKEGDVIKISHPEKGTWMIELVA